MFVTLEGPEGAGKSTLATGLAEGLRRLGHDPLITREPGAGALGGRIREILLYGDDLPHRTELFLFLADRAHHVAAVVRPALAAGKIVVCDRHADSTLVYQSLVRGLDEGFVRSANRFATDGLTPDLTLLVDLPPEVGLSRIVNPDRLDAQPLAFHRAVREGFLRVAASEPDRFRILDGTRSPGEVLAAALAALSPTLRPGDQPGLF